MRAPDPTDALDSRRRLAAAGVRRAALITFNYRESNGVSRPATIRPYFKFHWATWRCQFNFAPQSWPRKLSKPIIRSTRGPLACSSRCNGDEARELKSSPIPTEETQTPSCAIPTAKPFKVQNFSIFALTVHPELDYRFTFNFHLVYPAQQRYTQLLLAERIKRVDIKKC